MEKQTDASIHAEIQTALGTFLYGNVTQLSHSHVRLRIVNSSDAMQQVTPNMKVQLSISSSAGCYTALGRIQSVEEQILVVALSTSFLCEEHRRRLRISCAWPAMLRSVHKNGSRGAWKPAQVVDLSAEGIGLKISPIQLGAQWEVRIVVQEGSFFKEVSRARL